MSIQIVPQNGIHCYCNACSTTSGEVAKNYKFYGVRFQRGYDAIVVYLCEACLQELKSAYTKLGKNFGEK